MDGVDVDAAVGERIAELRKQKDLRQEDFMDLLEARGLSWTRATLSRIEGGQRALRAAELFVVADTLGVDVNQLNPMATQMGYQIESARVRYRQRVEDARQSFAFARTEREQLVALRLANKIQSGRSDFVVSGTPFGFIFQLTKALTKSIGGKPLPGLSVGDLDIGARAIGFDDEEVLREMETVAREKYPDTKKPPQFRLKSEVYERLIARRYPGLKFVGNADDHSRADLSVDGIPGDETESWGSEYVYAAEPWLIDEILFGGGSDEMSSAS